ncbi:hypothetical protein [Streptomyces sp. NPDC093589]
MTSIMASAQLTTAAQDDDTPPDPFMEEALRRALASKSGGSR